MGAHDFYTKAKGKTAEEAFDQAVKDAQWEHGHGGYTGTIAEKHSFVMIEPPSSVDTKNWEDLYRFGRDMLDRTKPHPIHDKWGPAGCIQLGPDEFLFFGIASS